MKKQDDTINKTGKDKAPVKSTTGNKPLIGKVKRIVSSRKNKPTEVKTKEPIEKPAVSAKQNTPAKRKLKVQKVNQVVSSRQNKPAKRKTKEPRDKPAVSSRQNKTTESKTEEPKVKQIISSRQNKPAGSKQTKPSASEATIKKRKVNLNNKPYNQLTSKEKTKLVDKELEETEGNFQMSKQKAEFLFYRAKEVAKLIGQVGENFRTCVYQLIKHNAHNHLGIKKTEMLKELREASELSRASFDNYRIAAEVEIQFNFTHNALSINELVEIYRIKDEKEKESKVLDKKLSSLYPREEYLLFFKKQPDLVKTFNESGDYPTAKELGDRMIEEMNNIDEDELSDKGFDKYLDTDDKTNSDLEVEHQNEPVLDKMFKEYLSSIKNKAYEITKTLSNGESFDPFKINNYKDFLETKDFPFLPFDPYNVDDAIDHINEKREYYSNKDILRLYEVLTSEDEIVIDASVICGFFDDATRWKFIKWLKYRIDHQGKK